MFDGDRYGGLITSYDGVFYQVRYPKDGDEEELSDNDFDGSDIEFLPVEGGSGAEDADSETDSVSGLKDPDAAIEEENSDQSDDEDGIYYQIITVPVNPASKRRKRDAGCITEPTGTTADGNSLPNRES